MFEIFLNMLVNSNLIVSRTTIYKKKLFYQYESLILLSFLNIDAITVLKLETSKHEAATNHHHCVSRDSVLCVNRGLLRSVRGCFGGVEGGGRVGGGLQSLVFPDTVKSSLELLPLPQVVNIPVHTPSTFAQLSVIFGGR